MPQHTVALGIILAILWLAFSGMWTHSIIVPLGAVSVVFVVYLAHRMRVADQEGLPLHLAGGIIRYWAWLMLEIVKANLTVARHIIAGNHTLSPRIGRIHASQHSELGRTILANSITLTPGTVTLEIDGEDIHFYALTEQMERDVRAGEMDRRAAAFEGER